MRLHANTTFYSVKEEFSLSHPQLHMCRWNKKTREKTVNLLFCLIHYRTESSHSYDFLSKTELLFKKMFTLLCLFFFLHYNIMHTILLPHIKSTFGNFSPVKPSVTNGLCCKVNDLISKTVEV